MLNDVWRHASNAGITRQRILLAVNVLYPTGRVHGNKQHTADSYFKPFFYSYTVLFFSLAFRDAVSPFHLIVCF